uniref:Rap-GAP domain-containing protein n=1 Tax=Macrostomum lignano TaxID=282301 RepID=A0A1I8JNW7_9PLAT
MVSTLTADAGGAVPHRLPRTSRRADRTLSTSTDAAAAPTRRSTLTTADRRCPVERLVRSLPPLWATSATGRPAVRPPFIRLSLTSCRGSWPPAACRLPFPGGPRLQALGAALCRATVRRHDNDVSPEAPKPVLLLILHSGAVRLRPARRSLREVHGARRARRFFSAPLPLLAPAGPAISSGALQGAEQICSVESISISDSATANRRVRCRVTAIAAVGSLLAFPVYFGDSALDYLDPGREEDSNRKPSPWPLRLCKCPGMADQVLRVLDSVISADPAEESRSLAMCSLALFAYQLLAARCSPEEEALNDQLYVLRVRECFAQLLRGGEACRPRYRPSPLDWLPTCWPCCPTWPASWPPRCRRSTWTLSRRWGEAVRHSLTLFLPDPNRQVGDDAGTRYLLCSLVDCLISWCMVLPMPGLLDYHDSHPRGLVFEAMSVLSELEACWRAGSLDSTARLAGATRLDCGVSEQHDLDFNLGDLSQEVLNQPNTQILAIDNRLLLSLVEITANPPSDSTGRRRSAPLSSATLSRAILRSICGKLSGSSACCTARRARQRPAVDSLLGQLSPRQPLPRPCRDYQLRPPLPFPTGPAFQSGSPAEAADWKLGRDPFVAAIEEEVSQQLAPQHRLDSAHIASTRDSLLSVPAQEAPAAVQEPMSPFYQCRHLVNQLGFLTWERRGAPGVEASRQSALPRDAQTAGRGLCCLRQEDKSSILSNCRGSEAFERFVGALGWELCILSSPSSTIEHTGVASESRWLYGRLSRLRQVRTTAPYYADSTSEIFFHVSTRMPTAGGAEDQLRKTKHLGNDEVMIVRAFARLPARHNAHASSVTSSSWCTRCHLACTAIEIDKKAEVPFFGPLFTGAMVAEPCWRPCVRATRYWGEPYEERANYLESLVHRFQQRDETFEQFAKGVFAPVPAEFPASGPFGSARPGSLQLDHADCGGPRLKDELLHVSVQPAADEAATLQQQLQQPHADELQSPQGKSGKAGGDLTRASSSRLSWPPGLKFRVRFSTGQQQAEASGSPTLQTPTGGVAAEQQVVELSGLASPDEAVKSC